MPNPDNIAALQPARAAADQATFDQLVKAGVTDRVRQQMALRNALHSDGEFWKARAEHDDHRRITGVTMQPLHPGEGPAILGPQHERHRPECRAFEAIDDQLGNIPRPGVVNPPPHKAVLTGPRTSKGHDAITPALEGVKAGMAAAGAPGEDGCFPVLGPGWLGHGRCNAYDPTEDADV